MKTDIHPMKKFVEADINLNAVDVIELVGVTEQDADFVMSFIITTLHRLVDENSSVPMVGQMRSVMPKILKALFEEFGGKRLTIALLSFGALKSEIDRMVISEKIVNELKSVIAYTSEKMEAEKKKGDILHT